MDMIICLSEVNVRVAVGFNCSTVASKLQFIEGNLCKSCFTFLARVIRKYKNFRTFDCKFSFSAIQWLSDLFWPNITEMQTKATHPLQGSLLALISLALNSQYAFDVLCTFLNRQKAVNMNYMIRFYMWIISFSQNVVLKYFKTIVILRFRALENILIVN